MRRFDAALADLLRARISRFGVTDQTPMRLLFCVVRRDESAEGAPEATRATLVLAERGEMPVSDALVRALLQSRGELIHQRMPTPDLAKRVAAQRDSGRTGGTSPATLVSEVDAALNSLEVVTTTEQARLCLIRAADFWLAPLRRDRSLNDPQGQPFSLFIAWLYYRHRKAAVNAGY